jgi:hypothetical protein
MAVEAHGVGGLLGQFHARFARAVVFSLTPSFSWVWKPDGGVNRFNGLPPAIETVETVTTGADPIFTQLKLGVNERSACDDLGIMK